MNVTNYSLFAHKPCYLLQWPNARILIDTPVDFTPFFSFLPHVYQSPRLKNPHPARKFNIPYLKEVDNRVYVEAPPEIYHVSTDILKMETVDAILVSNYESFIGLPFYTENSGFRGKIYVTELAYQYGKLLMEEMLEHIARIECASADRRWKQEDVCSKFPNPPLQNPVEWRPFYKSEDMHRCLTKIVTLSFHQTIDLFRVKVTPVPSGYSFGSAYWTMKTENERFAYLPATNPSSTDVKSLDTVPLRSVDYILVSSLCRLVDTNAMVMGGRMMQSVLETLRGNGSVLLPMSPVGPIFEVIEAISDHINSTNGISIDTPIYVVSPVVKTALAMAMISSEWMSDTRQNSVYEDRPREPFNHTNLVKDGRLKVYDSLYGPFSKEFKMPCVLIASHSSLRIGDAAHMVEVMGSDKRNAVILTDPDLPSESVRAPFATLPIRFLNIPMDFRMDSNGLQKLLADVKPKYVLAAAYYSQPVAMATGRRSEQILFDKVWPIEYDETVQISKLSRNRQKMVTVSVHPEILSSLNFKQHPTKKLAVAAIACHLSAYNDDFKLIPAKEAVVRRKLGKITIDKLMRALRAKNLEVRIAPEPDALEDGELEKRVKRKTDETILEIYELNARITVKKTMRGMKITASDEVTRQQLMEIMRTLLIEDDGLVGRKIEKPGKQILNVRKMRVWRGIQSISTIRRHPLNVQTPPIVPQDPPSHGILGSRIFDPDDWPLTWKCAPEAAATPESSVQKSSESMESSSDASDNSESSGKKKKDEVVEENRSDGHAPIKTACSVLMQGLQKSSSMTTSLSDIDVTLFNFHSVRFAERLLNRNVSSVVIVESSHVFSKSAKKFAEKLPNVDAYRADIYTLMGVGRKKTAQFPRKLLFSGESLDNWDMAWDNQDLHDDLGFGRKADAAAKFNNIRPLTLIPSSSTSPPHEEERTKFRRPHLLAVLPTATIQKTVVDSMIQHALLHHSKLDDDTLFRYGDTSLMTFLNCGILAQYICSTDARLHFLSHQHRRHSAVFDKLFHLNLLHIRDPDAIPIGHPTTSFHPQLPSVKKVTHEKKLAEVNLTNGMQYAVQISPRKQLEIDGQEVTTENGMGESLLAYACFMTQIGRQPNAKSTDLVIRSLFPESSSSIPADILTADKIGELPTAHLESIFTFVREELSATPTATSYCNDLKIKRIL